MAANERKAIFKALIRERMDDARQAAVSREQIFEYVQRERPDLCDDSEACYAGCGSHAALWRHQLERCIYDLRSLVRPALRSVPGQPGWYTRP